ncbi:MAG: carbohydrate ABC transporter permease [Calditrichaeota bacterium]|nr:carbohydrate ABC transporter permease [Calditrichota bacterium]
MIRNTAKSLLLHLCLFVAAAFTLIPFLWMLSASFMKNGEATLFPPHFVPTHISFQQYAILFHELNMGRYFLNSTILALGVTGGSLLVNAMAGFAFAKFTFPGKRPVFTLLLTSMIIPGQITMLPVFLLLNKLGLLNTYWGIILPGLASIFGIFLIRQYVSTIPDSLLEAAYMDGGSSFLIFWKIIMPLAKPVLITLALFTFMGTWNDFLWPLIVMTKDSMYTLPVGLAGLLGEHAQDTELMMAGSVITIIPIILIFLFLQKYYVQGILVGSIKE